MVDSPFYALPVIVNFYAGVAGFYEPPDFGGYGGKLDVWLLFLFLSAANISFIGFDGGAEGYDGYGDSAFLSSAGVI